MKSIPMMTGRRDEVLGAIAEEENRLSRLESERAATEARIKVLRTEPGSVALEPQIRVTIPLPTEGVAVVAESIDMTDDDAIVAVRSRGRDRQRIPILDLPLPDPLPRGAEWIEALRRGIQ